MLLLDDPIPTVTSVTTIIISIFSLSLHFPSYIYTVKNSSFLQLKNHKSFELFHSQKIKMAAKSIVSSTFFTRFSPLTPHSDLNHRNLLLALPWAINSKKLSSGVNKKAFRFCTTAGQRGNMEAVGVPTSVPVRVAHELLLAGHRFLDVRTPEEFNAGHPVGAVNVPYLNRAGLGMAKNPKFIEEVSSHFGQYDEILVGCQIGKRSMMAATELLAAGYAGVTDVAGGYASWTQNGLPTEK